MRPPGVDQDNKRFVCVYVLGTVACGQEWEESQQADTGFVESCEDSLGKVDPGCRDPGGDL